MLRIRDVYLGSRILIFTHLGSWIPDLGSRIQKQQQMRGVKKICCHTFLCSHKFHKNKNYFSFEVLKKKIWSNFQRIIELITQKIVTKLSKIWAWDPRSGIRKKPITDPGSRGQKGIGSRIRNTGFFIYIFIDMSLIITHSSEIDHFYPHIYIFGGLEDLDPETRTVKLRNHIRYHVFLWSTVTGVFLY